ncbi:Cytochrome c oxidase assembly protein cox19 [Hanseniaspora valbyensis]
MSAPAKSFKPIPPERGSFPLDHWGECTEEMNKYLKCLKITKGVNAENCKILSKKYLKCRMDNELMDKDYDWKKLGLPEDKEIVNKEKNSTNNNNNK